jgi:hypothetical protein
MKVVTYATHREGTLEKLVNNDFNVHVEVLGMGKKWNGYTDKSIGVLEFCKTLDPDEVVVFVDGFDSIIHRSPDNVEREFKKMKCGVLFSKVSPYNNPLFNYCMLMMFGTCKNRVIANAGMYMGYAKYMIDFITKSLENSKGDDQRDINNTCGRVNYVCIDEKCKIFKNLNGGSVDDKELLTGVEAPFVSFPGQMTYSRLKRSPREYYKFFILEIFTLISILYALNRKLWYATAILFIGTYLISVCT